MQLLFAVFGVAAVLGAPVGQHARERNAMAIEERHDTTIEQIGCWQSCLADVAFGKRHLRAGIDKGLMIDAPHAFERTDLKTVLRAAVAGALGFELTVCLLLQFGLLEHDQLRIGEHQTFLGKSRRSAFRRLFMVSRS